MITTNFYKGQEIRFKITDPKDFLQSRWLSGHFYEEGMLNFIENYSKEKFKTKQPVVIDVGACIGNHTIFFAKVMNAYVYAFEPVEQNLQLMKQNIQLNNSMRNVTIIPHGAGEHRGIARFKPDSTGNSGMGRISPDGDDVIKLIPIDQVISHSHEVDIMKIDVEGYNLPVLKGAMQTILKDHPEIYIECQTPEELQEAEGFLFPIGYKRWPTHFNATPTYFFYYKS